MNKGNIVNYKASTKEASTICLLIGAYYLNLYLMGSYSIQGNSDYEITKIELRKFIW